MADNLPVGVRFKPTKTQLINDFLKLKLSGRPWPTRTYSQFLEYDVYNDHPFNVLATTKALRGVVNEGEGRMEEGYFFSRLNKKAKLREGKRFTRCIEGHGTWSEKAKAKKVYDEAMSVIGTEKYFKFKPVTEGGNEPEWMMHEYSVLGNNEMVLCHIVKKQDSSEDEFGDVCRSTKRSRTYAIGEVNEGGTSNKRVRVEYGSSDGTVLHNGVYQGATDDVLEVPAAEVVMPPQGIVTDCGLDEMTMSDIEALATVTADCFNSGIVLNPEQRLDAENPLPPQGIVVDDDGLEDDTSVEKLTEDIEGHLMSDDGDDEDVSVEALTEEIEGHLMSDDTEDENVSVEALTEEIEGHLMSSDDTEDEDVSVEALTEEIEGHLLSDDTEDEDVSVEALTDEIEGHLMSDDTEDEDVTVEALTEEIEGCISDDRDDEDVSVEVLSEEIEGLMSDDTADDEDLSVEALTEEIEDCISDDGDDENVSVELLTEEIEGIMSDDTVDDEDVSVEALTEEIEGLMSDDEEDDTRNDAQVAQPEDACVNYDSSELMNINEQACDHSLMNIIPSDDLREHTVATTDEINEQFTTSYAHETRLVQGLYTTDAQDRSRVNPPVPQQYNQLIRDEQQAATVKTDRTRDNTVRKYDYSNLFGGDHFMFEDKAVEFTWLHALTTS